MPPFPLPVCHSGSSHTMALSSTGALFAWGNNGRGQLGVDELTGKFSEVVQVTGRGLLGGRSVRQVSAGSDHTLVLTSSAKVLAWGSNSEFQLGASNPAATEADDVMAGIDVRMISSGGRHSLVLSASGSVYSFGSNAEGQLGLGHRDTVSGVQLVNVSGA